MSDSIEAPDAAEATDTPVEESTATPEAGHGAPQAPDWESRYTELQPAFTRASQKAAELETWKESLQSDEGALREFLEGLGYELPEDDTGIEDFEPDPVSDLAKRVEAFEQSQAQAAEQQALQHLEAHVTKSLTDFGVDPETPLGKLKERFLVSAALGGSPGDNGMPNMAEAFEAWTQLEDELKKAWVDSKQAPGAPSGAAAVEVPDLDNPKDRIAWMQSQVQSRSA